LPLHLHLPSVAAGCVLATHGLVALGLTFISPLLRPQPLLVVGLCTVLSLAATALVMRLVGTGLSRRLSEIVDVLEHTKVGDYSRRVEKGPRDDIGILARSVNLLIATSAQRERRVLESALRERLSALEVGRLDTVRAFAADCS
jgi:HAMP domain-containing protein